MDLTSFLHKRRTTNLEHTLPILFAIGVGLGAVFVWLLASHTQQVRAVDTDALQPSQTANQVQAASTGVYLVKDIFTGTQHASPQLLTNLNGTLFFRASDGSGDRLWKSDGSEAGTVMVGSAISGTWPPAPNRMAAVGDTLFFADNSGNALWKTDGTTASKVKDIRPEGDFADFRALTGVDVLNLVKSYPWFFNKVS